MGQNVKRPLNRLKSVRGRPKGRPVDPQAQQEVQALIGDTPRRRDLLIEFLHKIQDYYGYISAPHLVALAGEMKLAPTEVYEVATFYHHFDVVKENQTPPPPLTVRVCDSVTCELFGARELINELQAGLGDGVRVQPVPCVGRCETAPVAVVGKNPVPHANFDSVKSLVDRRTVTPELPANALDYAAYKILGGYQLLRDCAEGRYAPESVIEKLEHSGLRGLGGAGFPAGRKWRILRDQPAPRLMAVNIDEGEPGTFKDRFYMERDPHRFFEGMLIAAWATGIDVIYIYLRDEYSACLALMEREFAALKADPPVPLPEIHLRRGAGAYICGEESAMIESIEGKRGMPRLRPPYVAEVGLFGRPTLEHNYETLHWVREILEKGPGWFAGQGRRDRKGLRSFSVSGRVSKPGVHLAPAGIVEVQWNVAQGRRQNTARGAAREIAVELVAGQYAATVFVDQFAHGDAGRRQVDARLALPASLGDIPLDFDTLQPYGCFIGSAAIIVLSDHDSAKQAALNTMRFFHHESCGQCTPCRVGTAKASDLMAKPTWDLPLLQDLAQVMDDASICGLGQAAANPMRCVIKYFPEELS